MPDALGTIDGRQPSAFAINSSATDFDVVPAQPGKTVRLYQLLLVSGDPTAGLTFRDGANDLNGPIKTASPVVLPFSGQPWFVTSPGAALKMHSTLATQISGIAYCTVG
jgi:hypothetical protein